MRGRNRLPASYGRRLSQSGWIVGGRRSRAVRFKEVGAESRQMGLGPFTEAKGRGRDTCLHCRNDAVFFNIYVAEISA